jgi:hypothetical protein
LVAQRRMALGKQAYYWACLTWPRFSRRTFTYRFRRLSRGPRAWPWDSLHRNMWRQTLTGKRSSRRGQYHATKQSIRFRKGGHRRTAFTLGRFVLEEPRQFGEKPSDPARNALNLFQSEGVRKNLELGGGQGRDTIFLAKAEFILSYWTILKTASGTSHAGQRR